jgi:hypothetical protein
MSAMAILCQLSRIPLPGFRALNYEISNFRLTDKPGVHCCPQDVLHFTPPV